MASIDAKICPQCGTRNKPQWEFCAGCGESVMDVTVVSAADAHALAGMVAEESAAAEAATPAAGVPWVSLLVLPALVVLAVVVFRRSEPPPPASASAGLFSVATPVHPPSGLTFDPAPKINVNLAKGRALLYAGDAAGAIEWLAMAVSEDSQNPEAHHLYAQALWQVGQKETAVPEYHAAYRLDPSSIPHGLDYARALASTGRYAEAITRYEALLKDRPDDLMSLRELSTMYIQTGAVDKAVPLLKDAAAAAHGDFARVDLALGLEQAGADAEAEKLYRQLLAERPSSMIGRTQLSDLLARTNRSDEALEVLSSGLDQAPDSAGLHRQIARVLDGAGRKAEAAQHYREYARLSPRARDAQDATERAARLESAAASPAPSS
jgi:tetratricopeptide (TPR) repeat protein